MTVVHHLTFIIDLKQSSIALEFVPRKGTWAPEKNNQNLAYLHDVVGTATSCSVLQQRHADIEGKITEVLCPLEVILEKGTLHRLHSAKSPHEFSNSAARTACRRSSLFSDLNIVLCVSRILVFVNSYYGFYYYCCGCCRHCDYQNID